MDFGEGRVEKVTEYFRQLANQNERTKEHWKGKTVCQLKISLSLLRNTTKGRARKPDTEEPAGDEIDTATRDALTKDTDASSLLPHAADEARNITDRCHMELVMMKSLEFYCSHCFKLQTLKLET